MLVVNRVVLFYDPMDCSQPGFSVHGISQARILEWVASSSSGDLPDPGIEPGSPTFGADSLPSEPPGKSGLKLNIKKLRSWHPVPPFHGK